MANSFFDTNFGQTNIGSAGTPELFQPNLYPYSFNKSNSSSSSYSGLPGQWSTYMAEKFAPMAYDAGQTLPQSIQDFQDNAGAYYQYAAQNALKNAMPSVVNPMANRGILSSSVTQNALRDAYSNIANEAGNKTYEANLAAQQMRYQLPALLAQLVELGKTSTASSSSYSEGGSANPLAPYELVANWSLNY